MADNNLKISIVSTLDQQKSVTEINRAIGQIAKDPALKTLSINIGVTDAQISKVVQQIKQIQDKLKTETKSNPVDIVPESSFNQFFTSVEKAIEYYKQFGTVKIDQNAINPLTGQVEKFTVSVTKSTGEIEKFKFQLSSLEGIQIGNNKNSYIPTVFSTSDNTQAAQAAEIDKLNQAMKKAYDQGLLTKDMFDQFNTSISAAKNVEEINKVRQAFQNAIQSEKNVNLQQSLISQSESLLNSGKNVDTVGINDLIDKLKSLNLTEEDATRQLALLQQKLKELQAGASAASAETASFGEVLKSVYANMTMYFGGFTLIFQTLSSFKNGISTLNDLNKSLTTISMITHQTQAQVQQLGDQYQQMGNQLSVSTTEIASSATELYRQGLSIDEVNSRLKTITEFSRVAGLTAQDATTYITAATNSMRVSAQQASDVFAMLGHTSGVNAGYIATAFQSVGGTAGALGLDFNKVASYIATIGERTKESADTIGNSVKSILARVQSLKEKGFDSTDGTQVNQVSKALAAVGIQLVDSQGQFRNFNTVLDELGAKWSSLDNRQKAYLATTVAGTYQQSR